MTGQPFFLAVAGLGLSIAGFGGLVTAFHQEEGWSQTELWRLRRIVRMGLICTFVGLVPFPIYAWLGNQSLTIRALSVLLAAIHVAESIETLRERGQWQTRGWVVPYVASDVALIVLQLANVAIGSLALVMIGLLVRLWHPTDLFLRVIGSFHPPITRE